jgi:hypothetical protein
VVTMKMNVRGIWAILLCSLYKLTDFSEFLLPHIITRRPEDGGSKHLRNVGQFLRDYTA